MFEMTRCIVAPTNACNKRAHRKYLLHERQPRSQCTADLPAGRRRRRLHGGGPSQPSRRVVGLTPDCCAGTQLGQTLFYRHTRAVELTEAGARYVEAIRPLLDQLEPATETIFEASDEPSGTLTINAPVAFGERQVVPLVYGFYSPVPENQDRTAPDRSLCRPGALGQRHHLPCRPAGGFQPGRAPTRADALRARRRPCLPRRRGEPDPARELLQHDCLRYQGDYGRQRWFWRDRTDTRLRTAGYRWLALQRRRHQPARLPPCSARASCCFPPG